ncbi:hypothetical protein M432DRAFT_625020 [Thermoascus aurantiacus ATCC 26904]
MYTLYAIPTVGMAYNIPKHIVHIQATYLPTYECAHMPSPTVRHTYTYTPAVLTHTLSEQDGKPYITNITAGPTVPDPRNKGFNIAVKTTFASLEDMRYYDTECEAHKALKAVAGPVMEEVVSAYYESVL